jgi:hypothetical protein
VGDAVTVLYFDRALAGRIVQEPLFDPTGERLRH